MALCHYYITYLNGKNFSNLQSDNFYKFIVRNSVSKVSVFQSNINFSAIKNMVFNLTVYTGIYLCGTHMKQCEYNRTIKWTGIWNYLIFRCDIKSRISCNTKEYYYNIRGIAFSSSNLMTVKIYLLWMYCFDVVTFMKENKSIFIY